MSEPNRERVTAGLVRIAVGLGLYLLERSAGIGQEAALLLIGGVVLVAYLIQKPKNYGILILIGAVRGGEE